MCSNPLTQVDAGRDVLGRDSLHTTVIFKNLKTHQGTGGLVECLICPECQTINHLGWLFCPQCGKQVDNSFLQSMELADQAPTQVAKLFPDPEAPHNPLETVVAEMPSTGSLPLEPDADAHPFPLSPAQWEPQSGPVPPVNWEPQPQLQRPAPTERPTPQTKEPPPPANWEPQPKPHRPELPHDSVPQPIEQPGAWVDSNARAKPNASVPALEPETISCAECGSDNSPDFHFCLSCGASLPVTKTVVMASIATRVKPRLRLLIKGELSGPTYEIRNEARIGRTEGSITFPHDGLMSTSHARVVKSGSDFMLIDETSSNGTFIKVKKDTKLEPGDVILVGGQLFRFEA